MSQDFRALNARMGTVARIAAVLALIGAIVGHLKGVDFGECEPAIAERQGPAVHFLTNVVHCQLVGRRQG